MKKTVLIVHAHPDPHSLNAALKDAARDHLASLGHEVLLSDLYAMGWKAGVDAEDFLDRQDPARLDIVHESGHAYRTGSQSADIEREQKKLLAADLVLFQFPLWWFSMPAILKGWIDRVFAYGLAYGYRDAGNNFRYGEGGLADKRALISTTVGGPAADYSPRGINGPLADLLFPLTHGTLFFAGMEVLEPQAIFSASRLSPAGFEEAMRNWRHRLGGIFEEEPVPFRRQNGGDYPDRHTLRADLAVGASGLALHRHAEPVLVE